MDKYTSIKENCLAQLSAIFKDTDYLFEDEIPNTYPVSFSSLWKDIKSRQYNKIRDLLKDINLNSLYLGIPYCNYRCSFCVYNVSTFYNSDIINNYLFLIKNEFKHYKEVGVNFRDIKRIYIGGGTPSILNESQICSLFEILENTGVRSHNVKSFTFELSPESISETKIELLTKYVNRFSIGVQDINMNILKSIRRKTNISDINNSLSILSKSVNYFNVDLIYGLPHQSKTDWLKTLENILKYNVPEITLYNLRVGKNSIIRNRSISLKEEKILFLLANKMLEENNYIQVRPFHWVRDLKIKKLWEEYKFAPFTDQHTKSTGRELGLGLSAVSHIGNLLFKNSDVSNYNNYSKCIIENKLPIEKFYNLSENDIITRKVLRGIEEGKFIFNQLSNKYKLLLKPLHQKLIDYNFYADQIGTLNKLGKLFFNNIEKETIILLNKYKLKRNKYFQE